jgi:class 3 adenylate cyclase
MTHADHAQIERKLAAIMLADIAGFSALMERDETRTYQRLRALRDEIVLPKVAEYGGRIVKTTGDGFLAIFPSATASLGCGITIQRVNISQEMMKDEQERFHLRIGINLGDVVVDGDDVSGDGVNIAARLEPLAPSDGICISGAIRDQVREDLGVELEDIGDQHVKNISRPVRAYRIDIASASGTTPPSQPDTLNSWGRQFADRRMLPVAAAVLVLAAAPLLFGPVSRLLPSRTPAAGIGDRTGRVRVASDETIRSAAASNGVDLPEVLEFHQPSAEVPDKFASYLGAWSSGAERWSGKGRRVILLIESIQKNGEASGQLGVSGPNQFTSNQYPAGHKQFSGKISDEGLQFFGKMSEQGLQFSASSVFRFQMVGADEMFAELEGIGDHGFFHTSIHLTRLK